MTVESDVKDDEKYARLVKLLKTLITPFVRVRVEGLENIPLQGGVIVCLNHVSNLDPIVTGVALVKRRPLRALVKHSLMKAPVVGGVMRTMKHIPVERGTAKSADAFVSAKEALLANAALVIYPEGTIPKDGKLGKFKTGAQRLSIETGVPIVPVGQWGIQKFTGPGKNLFLGMLKSLFVRPYHFAVVGVSIIPGEFDSVEALTTYLEQQIAGLTSEARKLAESA